MLFKGRNRKLSVSGQEIFALWSELGSLEKVSAHLTARGEVNPNTLKPFHKMTLWNAAIRWIITHQDEARDVYEKATGEKLRDGDWNNFLVRTARNVYRTSPSKFISWLEDNQWAYKYERLWKNVFPYAPKPDQPPKVD